MSGKKVNIAFAISVIFFAIYILVLPYVKTNLIQTPNMYDNRLLHIFDVVKIVLICVFSITAIFFAIANRVDDRLKNLYLLIPFLLIELVYPFKYTWVILLILALAIIRATRLKNYVSVDSYFALSLMILLNILVVAGGISLGLEKQIAKSMQEQVEKKIGVIPFEKDFFKYVTPVEEKSPYINMQLNTNGKLKYGYIDNSGNTKIPFEYDFATPFYIVNFNERKYKVAGVTEDKLTKVILKNKRVVMSYISKYDNEDLNNRLKEFEEILLKQMGQKTIETEIVGGSTNIVKKASIAKEKTEKCTYKYNLNKDKDILIYESEVGNPTRYTMKSRKAPFSEIELKTSTLIYTDHYLYTFKNGTIPFYDRDKNEQGWFMPDGEKITVTGKAQILDIDENRVLIKNHTKNTTYFVNYEGKVVSPIFRDVIIDHDRYLIKTLEEKWIITDHQYNKVFNETFDIVNTDLLSAGIYLLAKVPEKIDFNEYDYANIGFLVLTRTGHTIISNVDRLYNITYKFEGNKKKEEDINKFKEKMTKVKYINFGDKYYKN